MTAKKKDAKQNTTLPCASNSSGASGTLEAWRLQIDALDQQMAHLFVERMHVSCAIGAWKAANGVAIRDKKREQQILDARSARLDDPALAPYYRIFLEQIMALSRDIQKSIDHQSSSNVDDQPVSQDVLLTTPIMDSVTKETDRS